MIKKFCSGTDSGCSGSSVQYGWQTLEDCSSSQVCQMNGGTPQCVGSCQDTYIANSYSSCYGNPQSSGSPTLCLELSQQSGASWKYRVCKQGGTFSYDFTYRLKDENNYVFFDSYSGALGTTCASWRSFTLDYINGYGVLNGAGLVAEVVSPAGCSQSACQYKTGSITVYKNCQ
jgi:hypothetical protein